MKTFISILIVLIIGVGAYFYWGKKKPEVVLVTSFDECMRAGYPVAESYPRQCRAGDKTFVEDVPFVYKDLIKIETPFQNAIVTSPVTVSGTARGPWFFEASFPVEVLDEDGTSLGIAPVQAQGEWMTLDFVKFKGDVTFKTPKGSTGKIVFKKDNPSGLPENDDSVSIPIRFK